MDPRSFARAALLACFAFPGLSGCGAPAPAEAASPGKPTESAPSTQAPGADPSPPSAAAGSPSYAPLASTSSPASPAAPEPAPVPPPAQLTLEERKEVETKCAPIQKEMLKVKTNDPQKMLEEALKKPLKMSDADRARCADLLLRSVRAYLAEAVQVEAKVTLSRMMRGMIAAYQSERKLCPSTSRPVPADISALKADTFTSTEADWETPEWRCLGFSMAGQAQRFQYEVRSDPQAKTFRLIARGFPVRGGAMVELSQDGSVTEKGIEVRPVERR